MLFCYILRELNTKSDGLSKEALALPIDSVGLYEYVDREEIESMETNIYL